MDNPVWFSEKAWPGVAARLSLLLGCLLAIAASTEPTAAAAPSPSPRASLPGKGSTDPKDFPTDIPRYAPASRESYRTTDDGAVGYLRTGAAPEAVAAFYAAFAARERWTAEPSIVQERSGGRLMVLRKGDRVLRVEAFVNPLLEATDVILLVSRKSLALFLLSPSLSLSRRS